MTTKKESTTRIIGMLLPTVFAFIALAVQWGRVTTQLESFERRMNKQTESIEKTNETLVKVQEDLAFIKGKLQE